jgi:hypothetical protein
MTRGVIYTLIETAKLNDVEESLAVPLRARRSKTIMAVGSLFKHFARQVPRTRKPYGRPPRAQANPAGDE